jgi:glycosyltransferase involved in cell wall biosynthesis
MTATDRNVSGNSTTPPTLSVVVLNYNYERYLKGCIESILVQSFSEFEVIVIDDCSKDDSVNVIRKCAELDARVRLVAHEKNAGFARSLIEGTERLSRGEFLMVISADDLAVRPDAFATQIDLMRRNPQVAFCFSGVELIGPNESTVDRSFGEETVCDPAQALRVIFDGHARPAHSGTMIRAASYWACGGYRRDIAMALDFAMWLDLAIEGGFAYTPLALYGYRVHGQQMSVALAGIRRNAKEVRAILSDACAKGVQRGLGTGGMQERAFVSHFEAYAVNEAAHRNRRLAAYRVLATALEAPLAALRSRMLWISVLRAALGARGFAVAKSVLGR